LDAVGLALQARWCAAAHLWLIDFFHRGGLNDRLHGSIRIRVLR
jgi:hypothetical protein